MLYNDARVYYNYGLVLQHLNKYSDAETALLKANDLNPADPSTLYALVVLYSQLQQQDKVQIYANELHDNFPDSPQAQQLMQTMNVNGN